MNWGKISIRLGGALWLLAGVPALAASENPANPVSHPQLQSACDADPDAGISDAQKADACTSLINAGHEIPGDLSLDYLNRGIARYHGKQYDGALADFAAGLNLVPDNADLYFWRALAYGKLDNDPAAIADYTKVTELAPDYSNAYYNRSLAYQRAKNYVAASADIDTYIAKQPNDPDGYAQRGDIEGAENHNELAIDAYSHALQLKPDHKGALYGRAYDEIELQRYDAALSDIARYLNAYPDDADGYFQRARARAGKKDDAGAQADYDKVLSLDASETGAYFNRAVIFVNAGRYDLALADLNRYVAAAPDDADGWNERGIVYYRTNKLSLALADYDKAIAADPKMSMPRFNSGLVHRDQGRLNSAIEDFTASLAIAPDDGDGYMQRAKVYARLAKFPDAVADFSHAIALSKDDASLYMARGEAYYALKRYDEAVLDATTAIALKPGKDDLATAYVDRGLVHLDRKETDAAIADFSQAAALAPGDEAPYYDLELAYFDKGAFAKAETSGDKALALDASTPKHFRTRGWVRYWQGNYQGAIADWDRLVQLEKTARNASLRGYAYLASGQYGPAENDFEMALQLDRTNSWPQIALCRLRLTSGAPGAEQTCSEAFRPHVVLDGDGYLMRGIVEFRHGDFSAAINDADLALAKDQSFDRNIAYWTERSFMGAGDALYLRGAAKLKLGQDTENAKADIAAAVKADPAIAATSARLGVTP